MNAEQSLEAGLNRETAFADLPNNPTDGPFRAES